jgi:hypothetical protein
MTFGQMFLLYLMAGVGVAGAMCLSVRNLSAGQRCFRVATALLFWPMYLPVLLSRGETAAKRDAGADTAHPVDELAQAIAQVDAELDGALRSLDGWAEDVLAREKDRLDELRAAWTSQAQRIREMDQLLHRPEYNGTCTAFFHGTGTNGISNRLQASQEVIRENIERLRRVREKNLADLLGTLAWVRELASMIHLAKFTGAPPSRAEELVAQVAAAVEGLSALTWTEDAVPQRKGES